MQQQSQIQRDFPTLSTTVEQAYYLKLWECGTLRFSGDAVVAIEPSDWQGRFKVQSKPYSSLIAAECLAGEATLTLHYRREKLWVEDDATRFVPGHETVQERFEKLTGQTFQPQNAVVVDGCYDSLALLFPSEHLLVTHAPDGSEIERVLPEEPRQVAIDLLRGEPLPWGEADPVEAERARNLATAARTALQLEGVMLLDTVLATAETTWRLLAIG